MLSAGVPSLFPARKTLLLHRFSIDRLTSQITNSRSRLMSRSDLDNVDVDPQLWVSKPFDVSKRFEE
jgi:hypothetical protein